MPIPYGFASVTAQPTPEPSHRRRGAISLGRLPSQTSSHSVRSPRRSDPPINSQPTSPSWTSHHLCAMHPSPPGSSFLTSPQSPPALSPVLGYPAKRVISPGVYISKGEGHSLRHSWIIGGRLVDFPFPETHSDDGRSAQKRDNLNENTRSAVPIPIPIPIPAAKRNTHASTSAGSSF